MFPAGGAGGGDQPNRGHRGGRGGDQPNRGHPGGGGGDRPNRGHRGGRGRDQNKNSRGRENGKNNGGHRGRGGSNPQQFDDGGEGKGINTGRNRHEPIERRGPVFGFKRLHSYLNLPSNEVILSISKDCKDWEEFLKSDSVSPSNSNNLLHLIMQIFAEKVIVDNDLQNHQTEICVPTIEEKFRNSIVQQCTYITMGMDPHHRQQRYGDGTFTEVDKSPGTFLNNLLLYAQFMLKRMPQISIDFLSGLVASAFGASAKEFPELKDKFQVLIDEINLVRQKEEEKLKLQTKGRFQKRFGFTDDEEMELHAMEAPNDFREIPIIPTAQELLSKDEVFLRPNKKTGAYQDALHYLDVQFRLLREDFVQPLKKGVQDFMKHRFEYLNKKKKIPLGTIRIYPNVEIISVELVRDNTVFKVQLDEDNYKKIKWEKSKRLLTGSLLVFTADSFKSAFFAVIANRNVDELKKGIVSVMWEGDGPVWDRDEEYLMVECEVYFEAYRYSLQTLKELELDTFRMSKFIVQASAEVGPPQYLENTEHMLSFELKNGRQKFASPLLLNQWPTHEELGLDENQYIAFQTAITKEFVIIQGPPGTGKTFLGIKIVETFLTNEEIWGSAGPILVVCYTNHALDQFLEEIVDVYAKLKGAGEPPIVRVGGRCQSDKLNQFTLANVSRRKNRIMPKHFWANKSEIMCEIDSCRNRRSTIMESILALRNLQGIVDFEKLSVWDQLSIEYSTPLWKSMQTPSWFGFNDNFFRSAHFDEEILIRQWFDIREVRRNANKKVMPQTNPTGNQQEPDEEEDEEDYDVEELLQNRIIDDIYAEVDSKVPMNAGKCLTYMGGLSVKDLDKKIKTTTTNINRLNTDQKALNREQNLAKLEEDRLLSTNWRKFLDRIFTYYQHDQIELPDVSELIVEIKASRVSDMIIQQIPEKSRRWSLFFALVERARALCAEEAVEVQKEMSKFQKKLHEIQRFGDGWILQNSKIVGMTTTGAAKYNDLVKMMRSKIVIVEEAAEVLEAHIVTCITAHCEHLILIGDHRQLRPSTTVYDLAKKFNLDISLFERMINNNLNCYQLKVQHRMRPEIANLVVGTIYSELNNYPNVYKYPKVMGVTKNLFFISHQELEKSDSDSMSKSNMFEAKFLASFCRYLMLQGYEPSQVTVLTTYTGQMFLLKTTISSIQNCRGIRVTCVDNFQGEENDIILLSLVRSNLQSKIGFLNIENRICVAVSRAKHGLFIIGNINLLASKSRIWTQIQEKLETNGAVGPQLTLECQVHETETRIQCANDFNLNAPEGGCRLLCDALLECTHRCTKVCHIRDREHKNYNCMQPCLKQCENNHPCQFPCFRKKCPRCSVLLTQILPQCGHEKTMQCYQPPSEVLCQIPVPKILPCGHEEVLICHMPPSEYTCRIRMKRKLPCGHERNLECHEDPSTQICKLVVQKELACGHKQDAECRFSPEVIKCVTMIDKILKECNHKTQVRCCDQDKPINCKLQCDIRLRCGHSCTKICGHEDPQHLYVICKKDCARKCSEGHDCVGRHKCSSKCPPCMIEVSRKLPCGHTKSMPCHTDATQYECLEPCRNVLDCRHKCQNLCFQDCGPCQIIVKKRVPDCNHIIDIECNIRPTRDFCLAPVKSANRSLCGHEAVVPCRISATASPKEIMAICQNECSTLFLEEEGGCGHRCEGTCGKCLQGRFHIKCQSNCGKTLVCGHICDFPCSKACPPCDKKCVMRCEHSECRESCGTPCLGCNEPCPWRCKHQSCNKLCREQCDREPCDEPCPQVLDCGHLCIGFCGEPCPPHCRVCDKEHLTEFFLYGNEENEDARFVFLPDCKHSIEIEGLNYHMNLSDEGEIGMKRCPRCQTIIRHCRRFNNVIRRRLEDVILVKRKVFGNQKEVAKTQRQVIQKLRWDEERRWSRHFQKLNDYLLSKVGELIPVKRGSTDGRWIDKQVDEWTMTSINFLVNSAEGAIDILLKSQQENMKPNLLAYLHKKYRQLFANIMDRQLPLSDVEVRDINRELERLFDLNQIFTWRSNPKFTDGHSRALPIYDMLLQVTRFTRPYLETRKKEVRLLLKQLEDVLKTGLGISDMERQQILGAINLAQGRWFKCQNGHLYIITECGGAMIESKCNECGAPIGGQNHRVRSDNQFGGEMDGAAAPLWPNQF